MKRAGDKSKYNRTNKSARSSGSQTVVRVPLVVLEAPSGAVPEAFGISTTEIYGNTVSV